MRRIIYIALVWIVGIALMIGILLLMGTIQGCTSTKDVVRQTVRIDSTAIKEKSDSIRSLRIENEKLTSEIQEMQYAGIRFDTVYIPGDTVINTVTITKEGELKATGKIASAYVSKSVLTKIVNDKQRIIDSLSLAKNKEVVRTVVRTEYKDKHVKVTVFPWWFLLITGVFAFLWLRKTLK